jgi:hypothetical protein
MLTSQVTQLFVLFSGETDTETYAPVITNAISELENMLKDTADTEDSRLPFVAAAIANYRFNQITAAKDRIVYTPAGKIASTHNGEQQYSFAKSLMLEYINSISELLKDDSFLFRTTD